MPDKTIGSPPPGPGVDARGVPVVDPTRNVLDLVAAAIQRQDDLRESDHAHIRETIRMQAQFDLKMREIATAYEDKLREAESKRIDAIRAVDVGAVAVANTAAENRATTLAGQVNAAKDAQIVALKAETDPIRKDIGDLRQSQWTLAGGRQQGQTERAESDSALKNKGMWIGIAVAIVGTMASALLTVISIAVVVYVNKP